MGQRSQWAKGLGCAGAASHRGQQQFGESYAHRCNGASVARHADHGAWNREPASAAKSDRPDPPKQRHSARAKRRSVLGVVAAHRRSAVALAFLLARRTTSAGLAAAFAGWAVPSDGGIHVPVTCSANAYAIATS